MKRSVAVPLAIFTVAGALALTLAVAIANRTSDDGLVDLRARLWNVDDQVVILVDCKQLVTARRWETKTVSTRVARDAVVTVQAFNSRGIHTWGYRVTADGKEILRDKAGLVGWQGADGNDPGEEYTLVHERSVLLDGTRVPDCA